MGLRKYEFATRISMVLSCWRKFIPFGFLFSIPKGPSVCLIAVGRVLLVPTLQLMSCPKSRAVSEGMLVSRVWMVSPNSLCSMGLIG